LKQARSDILKKSRLWQCSVIAKCQSVRPFTRSKCAYIY